MLRTLVLAALGALAASAPTAQAAADAPVVTDTATRPPGRHKPIFLDTERLKNEVGLTDEQAAQVAEVAERYRPAPPSATTAGSSPPPRPDMQKMITEVNSLLSTEQQVKLKALLEKERPPHPPRDGAASR